MNNKLFNINIIIAFMLFVTMILNYSFSTECGDKNKLDTNKIPCTEFPKGSPFCKISLAHLGTKQYRVIKTHCIPEHLVGKYTGNLKSNPNKIKEQDLSFTITATPEKYYKVTSLLQNSGEPKYIFGITVTGIELDPFPILWWDEASEELSDINPSKWICEPLNNSGRLGIDCNNGHPDGDDTYHYHGLPPVVKQTLAPIMQLVGYAADGIPIYYKYGYKFVVTKDPRGFPHTTYSVQLLKSSWRLKSGYRYKDDNYKGEKVPCGTYNGKFTLDYEYVEGLGDLDSCNGRTDSTKEFGTTYYYVLTSEYPVIPRYFRGTPSESFSVNR